jgi:hypothetical protein
VPLVGLCPRSVSMDHEDWGPRALKLMVCGGDVNHEFTLGVGNSGCTDEVSHCGVVPARKMSVTGENLYNPRVKN